MEEKKMCSMENGEDGEEGDFEDQIQGQKWNTAFIFLRKKKKGMSISLHAEGDEYNNEEVTCKFCKVVSN